MKFENTLIKWKNKAKETTDIFYKKGFWKINKNNLELFFDNKLKFKKTGVKEVMGVGPNRINEFTIATIAESIAIFIKKNISNANKKGVVIAHDGRYNSELYLETITKVMNFHDIDTFVFKENHQQPSSVISYTVKKISAAIGINITAGSEGNRHSGVKLFNEKGTMMTKEQNSELQEIFNKIDPLNVRYGVLKKRYITKNMINDYIDELLKLRLRPNDQKPIKVLFSSLNGSADFIGPKLLQKMDLSYLTVKSEMGIDNKFLGKKRIDFDSKKPYSKSKKIAKAKKIDIVIIANPDASSIGFAYQNRKMTWKYLSGNQIAILIFNYLIRTHKTKGTIIQSIMSGKMVKSMAKMQKVNIIKTHSGFKNITEEFEKNIETVFMGWEQDRSFIFNYNISKYKDIFQTMILFVEAVNYLKTQNKNIKDELNYLTKKFGVHYSKEETLNLSDKELKLLFKKLMQTKNIGGQKVQKIDNYQDKDIKESKKKMCIKFHLTSNSWFAIDQIDEEINQKLYLEGVGTNSKKVKEIIKAMENHVHDLISLIKK